MDEKPGKSLGRWGAAFGAAGLVIVTAFALILIGFVLLVWLGSWSTS
jgi:hypothetical protein